jgi:isopentenyl diphosphate isomerase/L-lactate dehydrogenase-like FMN-dependent dehydrogenase
MCTAQEHVPMSFAYGCLLILCSNPPNAAGGRQLDHAVSAFEVLPAIVAAVNGKVPVLMVGVIIKR